jgi:hypothetical protein
MKKYIKTLLRESLINEIENNDPFKYFDINSLLNYTEIENPIYSIINNFKLGKLVFMSPDEYLEKTISPPYNKNDFPRYDKDKPIEFAERAKNGSKMPIGYYNLNKRSQEGRHRALAAKILNLNKIPVVEFSDVNREYVEYLVKKLKGKSFEEVNDYFKNKNYPFGISESPDYSELLKYIEYRL